MDEDIKNKHFKSSSVDVSYVGKNRYLSAAINKYRFNQSKGKCKDGFRLLI